MAKRKRKVKAKKKAIKRQPEVEDGQEELSGLSEAVSALTSRDTRAPQPQSLTEQEALESSGIDVGDVEQASQSDKLPLADIPLGSLEEATMQSQERKKRKRKRKVRRKKK